VRKKKFKDHKAEQRPNTRNTATNAKATHRISRVENKLKSISPRLSHIKKEMGKRRQKKEVVEHLQVAGN